MSGYRHAAEVLMSARKALTGPTATWRLVLERAHAPRIVVRETLSYGLVLSRSVMPQHLGSSGRRRKVVSSALELKPAELTRALLRAERRALLQGHVPRFILPPGSRALASDSGRPLVHRFAARAAAESVIESLETLSSSRLERVLAPALLASIL
jgi:lantibiotic modifying enzyme